MESANVIDICCKLQDRIAHRMTLEQKRQVRRKLKLVFRDLEGVFETGWNDQRIADELQLPTAFVSISRECNFGPVVLGQQS